MTGLFTSGPFPVAGSAFLAGAICLPWSPVPGNTPKASAGRQGEKKKGGVSRLDKCDVNFCLCFRLYCACACNTSLLGFLGIF